jgi:hypothetical protein
VRTSVILAVSAVILIAGVIVVPRPPADDSAQVLAKALRVDQPNVPAIAGEIRKAQRERCTPILEGSDKIAGRDTWAIRLRPRDRKYPWIEVWVDKRTSEVLAWKEWGRKDGRVMVLRRFPRT